MLTWWRERGPGNKERDRRKTRMKQGAFVWSLMKEVQRQLKPKLNMSKSTGGRNEQ